MFGCLGSWYGCGRMLRAWYTCASLGGQRWRLEESGLRQQKDTSNRLSIDSEKQRVLHLEHPSIPQIQSQHSHHHSMVERYYLKTKENSKFIESFLKSSHSSHPIYPTSKPAIYLIDRCRR